MKKHPFFIKSILLLTVTILIEFVLSNDISSLIHPEAQTTIDLSQPVSSSGITIMKESQSVLFTQTSSYVEFTLNNPVQSKNLFLRFESPVPGYVSGEISITDESRTNDYEILTNFSCNPGGKYNTAEIPLRSNGKLLKIKINITAGIFAPVYLHEVTLNYFKIHFHIVRWLIIVLLIGIFYCIHHFQISDMYYDLKNKKENIITVVLWIFNLGIAIFLLQFAQEPQYSIEYPLENDPKLYSIMVQQFDALQKGQLALDYGEDSLRFTTKANPYDQTQRDNSENWNTPYWDHVYYNGKIYSYFGLVPIFIVYYPYYWLTGTLPTDAFTAFCFSVLAISLCFLLIRKAISCFHIKANILDTFLTFLALPAASLFFLLQSSADQYYIPLCSANTFLLLFLYCSLAAYENRTTRNGIFWYIAAGIALGLSAASRPTTVIPIFLLIFPLYLHVLWDKKITNIQKGKLVSGFSIPVCIVAFLLMWYNYARFGSPFDFGTSHQLTVSDIHYNYISISPSRIAANLHQYWFFPLNLSENFPFIKFNPNTSSFYDNALDLYNNALHLYDNASHLYGNYTYIGLCNISVFAIPLNLALLALPAFIRSCKQLYQKAMLILGFIGGFIILYVDYCLGGVHIRYACDASLLFTILSLATLYFLLNTFRKYHLKQFVYVGHLLMICSILIGYLLIFSNERNYIRQYSPDAFLAFKNFFTLLG